MKIALINYSFTPLMSAISTRLNESGHQFITATATGNGCNSPHNVVDLKIGNRVDRAVHNALAWLSDTHGMHSTRVTASLLDRIIALNPDVVHLAGLNNSFINIPFMAYVLMRCKMPVALSVTEGTIPGTGRKSLIKRDRFRRKTIESTFGAWDLLHLVCDSKHTAERAAEEGLDGHPTYIISTDDTAKAVEQYITLYDNIKYRRKQAPPPKGCVHLALQRIHGAVHSPRAGTRRRLRAPCPVPADGNIGSRRDDRG